MESGCEWLDEIKGVKIYEVFPENSGGLGTALNEAVKWINRGVAAEVQLHPGIYREELPCFHFGVDGRLPAFVVRGLGKRPEDTIISGLAPLPQTGWEDLGDGLFRRKYRNSYGTHGDPWFPVSDRIGHRCEQLFAYGEPLVPISVEEWELSGFWNVETPADERGNLNERYRGYREPSAVLGSGEFAITEGPDLGNYLYLRTEDGGRPEPLGLEITARGTLLSLGAKDNLLLENLTFLGAGTFPAGEKLSSVRLEGPSKNHALVDCSFLWSSAFGLNTGKVENLLIRRCRFSYNGYGGLGLDDLSSFRIEDCEFSGNDWRNYLGGRINESHCTAGVKIHKSRGGQLVRCRAEENGINGIWLDIQCRDITLERCLVARNHREGLFFEFSYGPFQAENNLLIENGEHDYLVEAVGETEARGNIIFPGGGGETIGFGQGMRYNDHTGPGQAPGLSHRFLNNEIHIIKSGCDGEPPAIGLYNRIYHFQQTPEDLAAYGRFPGCLEIRGNRFYGVQARVLYEDQRTEERTECGSVTEISCGGRWYDNETLPRENVSTDDIEKRFREGLECRVDEFAKAGREYWKKIMNRKR